MEALVQEKALSQFVNNITPESSIIQPININIDSTNVTRMNFAETMTTNDGNYFIKYGGFPRAGTYNAIEVYSVNSLDNNKAVYVFDNLKIENHTFYIRDLKQAEDGRFYGVGFFADVQAVETYYYLIIFNNFIQDGYCQINKYYTTSSMGLSNLAFQKVTKVPNTGIYFICTTSELIKFEINILEGNKTSIATIVDGGTITEGSYRPQLNVFKDKLIHTRLWETEDYKYEYTKAVIDVNEDLPSTVTLNQVYYIALNANTYVSGATNFPFEAVIPISANNNISFRRIDINRNISIRANITRTFSSNTNMYAYLKDDYASVTDGDNIYLFYYDKNASLSGLTEFYSGTFSGNYSNTQILKQNNIVNLIGTASNDTQQSIVLIKNIYSSNVTSTPYYDYKFCLPYYMNLYSNSTDNTSLIFSRDATARFYNGNQITNTFIVPNYLLNDGNIERASVYGQTNYLLNSQVQDYEKNKFESLYFNFIYNLNVIDNTNGLNTFNRIGSNRIANTLWNSFDPNDSRLAKVRLTYEDLTTETIDLDIPEVDSSSVTFNYEVTGNIVKIEYLSNDKNTVYATFRTNLTGTNTITQTVRVQ